MGWFSKSLGLRTLAHPSILLGVFSSFFRVFYILTMLDIY